MSRDETWYKSRAVSNLRQDPRIRVQRFEDAFMVGLVDMFVSDSRSGIWLEAKHHVQTETGVVLPKSAITGNQIAWLQHWDRMPHPTGLLLFTDHGWLVCPQRFILSHLCVLSADKLRHLLSPHPLLKYAEIMESYLRFNQWAKIVNTVA